MRRIRSKAECLPDAFVSDEEIIERIVNECAYTRHEAEAFFEKYQADHPEWGNDTFLEGAWRKECLRKPKSTK